LLHPNFSHNLLQNMNKLLVGILFTLGIISTQHLNAQYAVGIQAASKFTLEGFEGDPFYGVGIRAEWFPYGNVAVVAGFNYYNGIEVKSFTRLEKSRIDVSPSFYLADLTTFYDRMSLDFKTRLFPFGMEYDDKIAGYSTLGLAIDYLKVQNDVGSYNATDYKFPNNLNGTSTKPIDEESMLGLYFNIGAGMQYQIGIITLFIEGNYALVGSQFKAEDKQYALKRNANMNIGAIYRFSKRRR
jgi:hypothetical protein